MHQWYISIYVQPDIANKTLLWSTSVQSVPPGAWPPMLEGRGAGTGLSPAPPTSGIKVGTSWLCTQEPSQPSRSHPGTQRSVGRAIGSEPLPGRSPR